MRFVVAYVVYVVFLAVFLAGCLATTASSAAVVAAEEEEGRGRLFVAARRKKFYSRWEKIGDDGDDQRVCDDDDDDDAADASSSSSSASSSSSSSTLNSWIDFYPSAKIYERQIDPILEADPDNRQDPRASRIGAGVVSKARMCEPARHRESEEECLTDAFRRFNYRILEVESE